MKVRGVAASFALVALTLSCPSGPLEAAPAFSDGLCPDATPVGQRINALNAQATPPSNADQLAAARAFAAAYRACAKSFDAQTTQRNDVGAMNSTDGTIVGRTYARVQEARAEERIGDDLAQTNDSVGAKAAYSSAISLLDEIGGIASGGARFGGGAEPKLVAEADALRTEVQARRAALAAASPASATSASPAQSR